MTSPFMSNSALVAEAVACVDGFSRLVADIPCERKDILYSEIFFLYLCTKQVAPLLHDAGIGTVQRKFIERHLPGWVASDDPSFVAVARVLDAAVADTTPPDDRATRDDQGYGYGLVCLPCARNVAYRTLLVRAAARGFVNRVFRRWQG